MVVATLHRLETRTLALLLLIATALTAAALAQSGNLLSSNNTDLVGEWRFDTGAGTVAYDTANNNDGTLQNFDFTSSSGWVDGKYGKALVFDGSDDYVSIGHRSSLEFTSTASFSFWIKPADSTNDVVLLKYDCGTGGWRVLRNGASQYQFSYESGGAQHISTSIASPAGSWTHVAIVKHGDKLYGYQNGERVDTDTVAATMSTATDPLEIGRADPGCGQDEPMSGSLDDIRIYDRALTDAEVKGLASQGKARFGKEKRSDGLVLDMGFDKQNGTHVFDLSGNSNHGTPQNGASQETAAHCKIGRCYDFDGIDDFVRVAEDASLDIADNITLMAWVKMNDVSSEQKIIDKRDDWQSPTGYSMFISSNQLFFEYGNGTDFAQTSAGASLPTNEWVHLAVTKDRDAIRYYKNGILLGTNSPLPDGIGTNNVNVGVGKSIGRNTHEINGSIDQAKVFDRSLSEREIIEEARLDRDGAVLDLRFDAGGGDLARDVSVHGNDATLQPNESFGPMVVDGISGSAYKARGGGVGDSISVSSPTELELKENLAVSLWFKPGLWSDNNWKGTLFRKNGAGSGRPYWLYGAVPGNVLTFEMRPDTGVFHALNSDKTDWNQNRWYHVVAQYKNNQTWELYVNGRLDAQQNDPIPVSTASGNFDLAYGLFNGSIDNVKIFPYALSRNQINNLYRGGSFAVKNTSRAAQDPGQDGLVLYQGLDNFNGTHMLDGSGYANHGAVSGAVEEDAGQCQIGRCLRFDGSDDEVVVPTFTAVDGSSAATWSFWVNIKESGSGNDNYLAKYPGGTDVFIIDDGVGSNTVRATVYNGTQDSLAAETGALDTDTWNHVVVVYDSDTLTVHVNGRQEATNTVPGFSRLEPTSTAAFELGSWKGSGIHDRVLDGKLDEVRIYNRSLSDGEVWSLYAQGRDRGEGSIPGALGWWRFEPHANLTVFDRAGNSDGTLQGTLQGDFEGGQLDGWGASCRSGASKVTANNDDGYRGDGSLQLWNGSCAVKSFSVTDNQTIYYAVKPTGGNYDSPCLSDSGCQNTRPATLIATDGDWRIYRTTATYTGTPTMHMYGSNKTLYDFITLGPMWVPGKNGFGLSFDGEDDYVNAPMDASGLHSYSLSAWVKWDSASASSSNLGNAAVESVSPRFDYSIHADSNSIKSYAHPGNPADIGSLSYATDPTAKWYHIVSWRDHGDFRLYVDGELRDTDTVTDNPLDATSINIGKNPSFSGDRFNGTVDDVRFYPYALTEDQIQQVMNSGKDLFS